MIIYNGLEGGTVGSQTDGDHAFSSSNGRIQFVGGIFRIDDAPLHRGIFCNIINWLRESGSEESVRDYAGSLY